MAVLLKIAEANGEKRANVVFFHGLDGDMRTTWRAELRDIAFWPAWLAEDIEGLSIYSVGYEAPKTDWDGSAMHLIDQATNVLERLLVEADLQEGPLIFLGHSLGGLIIKQLLRDAQSKAENRVEAEYLTRRVEKVAFLATPHTGSGFANVADNLRRVVRPSSATASLRRNDPNLLELNDWYRDWANYRRIPHLVLTETKPWHGVSLIVEPDSANPALAVQKKVPVGCDHENICKPLDRDCEVYLHCLHFVRSPLRRPRELEDWIHQLPTEIAAQLVAILDQRSGMVTAADGGLEGQVILQLARRLKPEEVIDRDQAIKELENAVQIALDVIAKGERGTNLDDFVQRVLRQLADTTKGGDFDAGSSLVDESLKRLDEEHRASKEALLEAGVEQDILRRDAFAVVRRIEAIAALDPMEGHPVWSQEFLKRLVAFHEQGETNGINLSLEVAIEMARRMVELASNAEQRGVAHYYLGLVLLTVGGREIGSEKLKEAHTAFEVARGSCQERSVLWLLVHRRLGETLMRLGDAGRLRETEGAGALLGSAISAFEVVLEADIRERFPIEWAAIKNNLGIAYRQLGRANWTTEPFINALRAYNESLEMCTRELQPLSWSITKSNIGNALSDLADLTGSGERYVEAEAAYRAALSEKALKGAPLEWARTQQGLGTLLLAGGQRSGDAAKLKEAAKVFGQALTMIMPDNAQMSWAQTQQNLAAAYHALYDKTGEARHLDEALEAIDGALDEYLKARAAFYIEKAERLREKILAAKGP